MSSTTKSILKAIGLAVLALGAALLLLSQDNQQAIIDLIKSSLSSTSGQELEESNEPDQESSFPPDDDGESPQDSFDPAPPEIELPAPDSEVAREEFEGEIRQIALMYPWGEGQIHQSNFSFQCVEPVPVRYIITNVTDFSGNPLSNMGVFSVDLNKFVLTGLNADAGGVVTFVLDAPGNYIFGR